MLSSLNRRLGLRNFKGCCVLELWYVLYTAIWFLLWQVKNVAKALRTNLEDGFSDSPEEIQKRKEAFGDNTYPKKKPKGFLVVLSLFDFHNLCSRESLKKYYACHMMLVFLSKPLFE
jgi:magnesium-transporting ATPase (P-type)